MLPIVRKILFEKRVSIAAWAIGAAFMVWLTLIFYPSFSQGDQLEQLVKSLPPQLQSLVGQSLNFKTLGGYLDSVVFNLRIPLITIIMAIIFGISLSAGDEERGTLATLLAQPVSRGRVLLEKFMALVASVAIVHLGVSLGILISLATIGDWYSFGKIIAVTFGCFLITVLFGTLAFGLGMITGKRGMSMGIVSAATFGAFLIDSMAPSVHALQSFQKFSPYYYYTQPGLAVNGVDWLYVSIQLILIGLTIVIAWGVFRHRDVEV